MSSRSKRSTRNTDAEKKSPKAEEIPAENVGRRRSLRNSGGPSSAIPVTCKKPSSNFPKSKQMEKVSTNAIEETVSKNRNQRSTRNSSQKKNRQTNPVSNLTPKRAPVSKVIPPVRVSPRNAANGSIDSSVSRRTPRRKANSIEVNNDHQVKVPEGVEDNRSRKLLRKSNRKRHLSPDPETVPSETSIAMNPQPSKRRCETSQTEKPVKSDTSTHANGDVSKCRDDISDESKHTGIAEHSQKSSAKRPLQLSPDDANVETPVSKKIKHDIPLLKLIENSPVNDRNKSPLQILDKCVESLNSVSDKEILESTKSTEKSITSTNTCLNSNKTRNAFTTGTMEVSPKENEDMLPTNNMACRLFEECNLNDCQKKELFSLLPENSTGLNMEDLVEYLVKKLLEEGAIVKSMTSPRFNKFLRNLLNIYCNSESSTEKKHWLCENALNWAKERKTVNLTHELELALMNLYYHTQFYKKAEQTANILYSETKKLQDKEKTVQACLCLSQTYHAMGNISKARANITTAKTEALKIYTAPDLQAELDLQSGIMQIAEEKDMETAFSYFKEAATAFTIRKKRCRALKYMLLSKLLVNRPDEGEKLVQVQCHIADIDEGVEALIAITKAAMSSSLEEFKKGLDMYNKELKEDLVVKDVIDKLYTKMLEKNLVNIIKPYDKIQISYVATRIGLPRDDVERRLSQLILDGQVKAQLDHRDDCLYVYETEEADRVYPMAVDTMSQLDRTLTHLNKRVKQLLL